MSAIEKKQRPSLIRKRAPEVDNTDHSVHALTPYRVISVALLIILTLLLIFPLYWIITGSFKTKLAINARVPVWFPVQPTMDNYQRLFQKPAMTWLFNTVLLCAAAMGLTCI